MVTLSPYVTHGQGRRSFWSAQENAHPLAEQGEPVRWEFPARRSFNPLTLRKLRRMQRSSGLGFNQRFIAFIYWHPSSAALSRSISIAHFVPTTETLPFQVKTPGLVFLATRSYTHAGTGN